MNRDVLAEAVWRKSSRSNGQSNCVEVAFLSANVAMRDSKQGGSGPILCFTHDEWGVFLTSVEGNQFKH